MLVFVKYIIDMEQGIDKDNYEEVVVDGEEVSGTVEVSCQGDQGTIAILNLRQLHEKLGIKQPESTYRMLFQFAQESSYTPQNY